MDNKTHILVVDDDPQICDLLQDYLQQYGFIVTTAHNGDAMQAALDKHIIQLVILDLMLPGDDGLTLCKKLREQSDVIIIMLSAVHEESDRIVGLEIGADDYLPKPFSPRELLARIKAQLRRSSGQLNKTTSSLAQLPIRTFNQWQLDCNRRVLITHDHITVPLSSGEYELLLAFLNHPNRVLSRDQLIDLTRGENSTPFDRSIDTQVARLRKKIEPDPKQPTTLITVRGGGYQFITHTHSTTES